MSRWFFLDGYAEEEKAQFYENFDTSTGLDPTLEQFRYFTGGYTFLGRAIRVTSLHGIQFWPGDYYFVRNCSYLLDPATNTPKAFWANAQGTANGTDRRLCFRQELKPFRIPTGTTLAVYQGDFDVFFLNQYPEFRF